MNARRSPRRRYGLLFVAALLVVGAAAIAASSSVPRSPTTPGRDVQSLFARDVDSLDVALGDLSSALNTSRDRNAVDRVRPAFRRARTRYKHVEALLEFYSPALAAALNSRRQEVDDDDQPPPSTLAPSGFPALEGVLWGAATPSGIDSARSIVAGMRATITRMRWLDQALVVTDPQLIEVARLELVRISTLGIAGFDAPTTGAALIEAADALDALRETFAIAGPTRWPRLIEQRRTLDADLRAASAHLRSHNDFASSDRLSVIVGYLIPAARALNDLRLAAHTEPLTMPRALRAYAETPFDVDAFDPRAYTPSGAPRSTRDLLALGARLFAEPRLSGNATRSCASCHNPARAFTDGLTTSPSMDPHGAPVTRNTPTLVNAGLQPSQFADERAASLEDQVAEVLRSPVEMGSSAERAAEVLERDSTYRAEFARAFGVTPERAVTPLRLRQAIAAYVRGLVALDSRFDRAVRGDTAGLSREERRGFTLFMGKAGCGTCHFAPLFSGDTPPLYRASDVEVIGTPRTPRLMSELDPDSGRARIDRLPTHLRAFKTPSLRNVGLTAPYMHSGAFRTLDEVLDFYNGGGALGAGAKIADQTLAPDSLHLTAAERHAIVAFLLTLTDTVYAKR